MALHNLRENGWVCSRSAMSHSPVDIFAGKNGVALLVQVKSGTARMSKAETVELFNWAEAFNARAELWLYKKGGHLIKKTIRELEGVTT